MSTGTRLPVLHLVFRRALAPGAGSLLIFSAALQAGVVARAGPRPFVEFDLPPLVLPNDKTLVAMRERMSNERYARLFAPVMRDAQEALAREPQPLAVIHYEGLVSNHPDRVRSVASLQDMRRLRHLVWATWLTGDDQYAHGALRYVRAWVSTYRPTGNDVNENKLTPMILARYALGPQMTQTDRRSLDAWLMDIARAQWAGIEKARGNRLAKRIALVAAIARVLDEPRLLEQAEKAFDNFLRTQIRSDGRTYDLEIRDALHYHVSSVSAALSVIVVLGRPNGLEHAPAGAGSVKTALDYLVPYALGEKPHAEWVNSKVALDRRRFEAGDEFYRPGRLWDPRTAAALFDLAALVDERYAPVAQAIDVADDDPSVDPIHRALRLWKTESLQ